MRTPNVRQLRERKQFSPTEKFHADDDTKQFYDRILYQNWNFENRHMHNFTHIRSKMVILKNDRSLKRTIHNCFFTIFVKLSEQ